MPRRPYDKRLPASSTLENRINSSRLLFVSTALMSILTGCNLSSSSVTQADVTRAYEDGRRQALIVTPTPDFATETPTRTPTATRTPTERPAATETPPPTSTARPPATETPPPTSTARPPATETPRRTPTAEPPSELFDDPNFDGVDQGQMDETFVLDNSDRPLRGLSDLKRWLVTMRETRAHFPNELDQQVPFFSIFNDALPGYETGGDPIHLGFGNPEIVKTDFESLRMHFEGLTAQQLEAASLAVTQNLVRVQYQGEERWAFTGPIDSLDTEGALVLSPDGLSRGLAFTDDYEQTQLALFQQFLEAYRQAESQNGGNLTDREHAARAFNAMQLALAAEGWESDDTMQALYVDRNGDVQALPFLLLREPISTARVQEGAVEGVVSNDRADQDPEIQCVMLQEIDGTNGNGVPLADFSTEIDALSGQLVLTAIDIEALALRRPFRAVARAMIADLATNYELIPGDDTSAFGYELSPELVTNEGVGDDPFGTTLFDRCGVGEGFTPVTTDTVVPPTGTPERTPTLEVTPTPEFSPTPESTPTGTPTLPWTPTPLPTNLPESAPTRPPIPTEEWMPTLVPTPENTDVPATEAPLIIPPTPTPPAITPTPVF